MTSLSTLRLRASQTAAAALVAQQNFEKIEQAVQFGGATYAQMDAASTALYHADAAAAEADEALARAIASSK